MTALGGLNKKQILDFLTIPSIILLDMFRYRTYAVIPYFGTSLWEAV